jgi:hypothetical protein
LSVIPPSGWEARGYELVGRIIVAWGRLDQKVTSVIWRDNDPNAPFPTGPVPHAFYKRLNRWFEIQLPHCAKKNRGAFNRLRKQVEDLSDERDNLAHNVSYVSGHAQDVTVFVHRFEPPDWRTRFNAWAARTIRKAMRLRTPPPANLGKVERSYFERDLLRLLGEVEAASARITAIGEAIARGEQF